MIEIRKPMNREEAMDLAVILLKELERIHAILDDVRAKLEEKYGTTS